MTFVDEDDALELIRRSKRIFLLEPNYRRKYPPLGLAKIATYAREHGASLEFGRRYQGDSHDLVCITSLFTSQAQRVEDAYHDVRFFNPTATILVGGIYASLMTGDAEWRMPEAMVFRNHSKTLDQCVPSYDIDWGVEDPWGDFSFTFTSRGCANRCPYCAVHRLEPEQWVVPNWRDHIIDSKPNAMVSDNNLSACPPEHLDEVLSFLAARKKRVVFDNGFDCKLITDDMASKLARLKYTRHGMRLAFDRIEEDGVFQDAVRRLIAAGVPRGQMMAYVLFNFQDTPEEADYRMRECVRLGIRPYPQRYEPLNRVDSTGFVGKHWTADLVRSFRYFWLMAGLYQRHEFFEWSRSEAAGKYRMGAA